VPERARIYVTEWAPDRLLIQATVNDNRGQPDEIIGDFRLRIGPGEDVFGYTYEELRELGVPGDYPVRQG
jgi:hypothetical protein